MTTIPAVTIDTPEGTRVKTDVHVGYVPSQYRPIECKTWCMDPNHPQKHWSSGCKHADKRCEGRVITVTGTYTGTTYWMDNSIDGTVVFDEPLEDGRTEQVVRFKAPSGDACF